MDAALLAWGRAVKQRRRSKFPPLWLFTDSRLLPDPLLAIGLLPPGLCGVVFRHDGVGDRPALAARVAALCKRRRIALVVAGDARLALRLGAGVHLRGGRFAGVVRPRGLRTSSAHGIAELRRAGRAGAKIVFLSPAFQTVSHPGLSGLRAVKWAGIARNFRNLNVAALGGINGANIRLLGRHCAGAGAITALSLQFH